MVCVACEYLVKIYIAYLDEFVDLLESRRLVDRVWPELQARTLTAEVNLADAWYWLSEHRSEHHVVQPCAGV
jgi:hypothetical protein